MALSQEQLAALQQWAQSQSPQAQDDSGAPKPFAQAFNESYAPQAQATPMPASPSPSPKSSAPVQAGAPSDDAKSPTPDVRSYLMQKFGFGQGLDDDAIKGAQQTAGDNLQMVNFARAAQNFGNAAGYGGVDVDKGLFDSLAKQANAPVDNILQRRKGKEEELGMRKGVNDLSSQEGALDPNSSVAQSIRRVYGPAMKKLGLSPDSLNGLNPSQIKEFVEKPMEFMEKLKAQETQRSIALGEQQFKHIEHAGDQLNHDDELKKMKDAVDEADMAKKVLADATSNPQSARLLSTHLATLASHGQRLHQATLHQATGSADWANQLKQAIETGATGSITPENAEFARRYIETVGGDASKKVEGLRQQAAKLLSNRLGGKISPAQAYEQMVGKPMASTKVDPSDPRVKQALQHGYSPDEIASYLNGK